MISLRKGAVFCVFRGEPPPPNFAKIHARVGRGRLERAPRDSIPPRGHSHFRGLKCRAARFATGVAFRRHRPSGAAAGGGVPGAARSRLQAGVPGGRAWPAAVGRCRLGGSSRLSGAGAGAAQRGHVAGLFQGGVLPGDVARGGTGRLFGAKPGKTRGLGRTPAAFSGAAGGGSAIRGAAGLGGAAREAQRCAGAKKLRKPRYLRDRDPDRRQVSRVRAI